jgi:molybdopterin synthase catalytic subunit
MPHRLLATPLSPDAPVRDVSGPDCGAIVTFVGTVRGQNHGKPVVALEYEAYPAMALKVFARITLESQQKWPGCRLAIHHRTGSLAPGDLAVVIAAATPHRAHAFEACRYAIEALKTDAPIWKRERYHDGSEWVGLGS